MVTFLQNFALSEYASIIRPKAVKAYLESVSKQDQLYEDLYSFGTLHIW